MLIRLFKVIGYALIVPIIWGFLFGLGTLVGASADNAMFYGFLTFCAGSVGLMIFAVIFSYIIGGENA